MAEDKLAVRPPVLEGEIVDTELADLVQQYGLFGGITILLQRRLDRQIAKEFLTAGLPPGVNGPVIDL